MKVDNMEIESDKRKGVDPDETGLPTKKKPRTIPPECDPQLAGALARLGLPDNLPEAVNQIISGDMSDLYDNEEEHYEQGRAAARWLVEAAKSAHLHPDIKFIARRLAAQKQFTAGLGLYSMDPDNETSLLVFQHLQNELRPHLSLLGAKLEALYNEHQLGAFFSKEAIDDAIVFHNPEFEDTPEPTQGMAMPGAQGLFDYSDAAPVEEMNERKFLHALMMVARLAELSFQQRVLCVAARFGMSKGDRSFQALPSKSYVQCAEKVLSNGGHRYKSRFVFSALP